jgi:hypothetical protein
MRLGNAVFGSRVAGVALFGAELALTGDAPLQLRLNFGAASLLHRISATGDEQSDNDDEEERPGFHPLILETKRTKANRHNEQDSVDQNQRASSNKSCLIM